MKAGHVKTYFSSLRCISPKTCYTVIQVIRPGCVLLLSCVTRSLISLKNVDISRFVLEKNIMPDLWNLGLKAHTFHLIENWIAMY